MTHILDGQTGQFVSQEHRRIAELITQYDPTLALVWIPPAQRELNEEFPYAVLHSPGNVEPYIVRKVREQDMNADLVAWLFMSDGTKNMRDLNTWQDVQEKIQKDLDRARVAELQAEQFDFAQSVLNGKNFYRHNGKVYS